MHIPFCYKLETPKYGQRSADIRHSLKYLEMCTKKVEAEKRYIERKKNKHLYKVDMGGPP